jgi:transcriptional regulator with PAS, ATPase and Fis domain
VDNADPVRELLTSGRSFSDLEINVGGHSELSSCLASAKPIKDEQGNITSGVLFLNPIHKINKLINRFSGAHATFTFDDIIGSGKALTKAIQQGVQAASSESNVLLRGESGTGKEMFAQAIHNRSARRQGPFIAINCGAIPRELIGSELFGYVEGAFTGAHKRGRPGKFELASGGTLFLDEIGDMPLDQQVSLLRVLQDKSITRIGGDKNMLIDVRIICATNKDLRLEITRGNFRQDLYYRLNVISITLPPLREHREDIPLVFKIFYERTCRKLGVEVAQVDPEVMVRLQQYDWPGNMREFQNAVEKMVNIPHQHHIEVNSLPDEIMTTMERHPAVSPIQHHGSITFRDHRARIKEALAEQERTEILELISQHKGNLSQTARSMGISRTSLYRKLAKPDNP